MTKLTQQHLEESRVAELVKLDAEKAVPALLERAAVMAQSAGPDTAVADNPALQLGAAMGELALAGRDKVTYVECADSKQFSRSQVSGIKTSKWNRCCGRWRRLRHGCWIASALASSSGIAPIAS